MAPEYLRQQHVSRARLRIERDGFPRVQMFFLVALTGAAGFLASFSLLHAGVDAMWLRYPIAVGIAYLVFLVLLWLWLRTRAEDYADIADPSFIPMPDGSAASRSGAREEIFAGKGGGADGGGASGSFELAGEETSVVEGGHETIGEALGAAAEAEEFSVPLIVIVLVAAAAFSSLFVIYSAPLLFAELLVDGVLAASLYRRLRGIEQRHWLETALRRTFLPFLLTACFAAAAGWAMAVYAPGANSIGKVLTLGAYNRETARCVDRLSCRIMLRTADER